jgi:ADP-ribosylglycohydrolase/sugar/nucleoside kinase (ribokinase family)
MSEQTFSQPPTILVAGSAALLDLILHVDRFPGPSEVANLLANADGRWLPGGCAMTIALAATQQGVKVRLWHPLPQDSICPLSRLRRAGIDLTACPRFSGPVGRCVLVYAGQQRASWTTVPQGDDFDFDPSILSGVSHVVVTAKWGRWTDRLIELARANSISCSLVGEAPPAGLRFPWHTVVVDEHQSHRVGEEDCRIRIVTRGREGATITWSDRTIYVPAVKTDVVETTGAGDVFGGTFMGRLLQDPNDVPRAAADASVMAARACSVWGAQGLFDHTPESPKDIDSRIRGALWGLTCGDAFGMPNAFMRHPRWLTEMEPGPLENPYHAGYSRGRITDDTEQALALTAAYEDADGPSPQAYARRLFAWFEQVGGADSLAVGPSTMQAMLAYGRGVSVEETGLQGVTNGAAMRIAPIGIICGLRGCSLPELLSEVWPTCIPTHNTAPAISGAMAVAAAVSAAIQGLSWSEIMQQAIEGSVLGSEGGRWHYAPDLGQKIKFSRALIQTATSPEQAAKIAGEVIGAGTPVAESIAAAIAIADFAGGDPREAIEIAGNTMGDSDTVAAIAGAICGAFAGEAALPLDWRNSVAQSNNLDIGGWASRLRRLSAEKSFLTKK